MTSTQQPSRPAQNLSKSTSRSLIFLNIDFNGDTDRVLQGCKRHYSGIESIAELFHEDNNGNSIRAIQINLKSDKSAEQFIGQSHFHYFNREYLIQTTLPQSLIVSKVNVNIKSEQILQDLKHNYMGIEKIVRFYDVEKNMVDHIRIDFKSDSSVTKIIKDDYILIDGKRCPVQSYRSLIYVPQQNGNKPVAKSSVTEPSQKPVIKNPPNYLTEKRVKELFREQQMQLEAMINQFENKWNTRLSSLTTPSTNVNVDQLLPIIKDLSTVCQQFNHQNGQIQKQLNTVVHRVQHIQMNLNNEQTQQDWPQLSIQNGH